MTTEQSTVRNAFDTAHAEAYDRQFVPIRAVKDALHLLMRVQLAELPSDARILVVGAGTGAEVRYLAPLFPGWHFTLVDPSAAMLQVARRHAEAEGFGARCAFHEGYLDTLPRAELHHAATSVLVSHFLTSAGERQSFFEEIASRVLPGGLLFNADLCADRSTPSFDVLMELWLRLIAHAGMADGPKAAQYRTAFGRDFAAHGRSEVEAMIARAGFSQPVACYQALLIRAWTATRREG